MSQLNIINHPAEVYSHWDSSESNQEEKGTRSRSIKQKGDITDAARPTIWLYMLCRRYFIRIRNMCTIIAYTITYSEYFLYKWSTRLQSMHNHMVGRSASVVSPFYFILLERDKDISHMKEVTGFLGVYSCRYTLYTATILKHKTLYLPSFCSNQESYSFCNWKSYQILQFEDDSKVGFNVWNKLRHSLHVDLTVLSIFQKAVTFDHNLTP